LFKSWFDKKQGSSAPAAGTGLTGPRVPRNSSGWATLRRRLQAEPGLRVIDVGYTSPTNINYLTSLGHSVFMADLVQEAVKGNWQSGTDAEGNPIWNIQGFLDAAFNFGGRIFDVVLLWTALDYTRFHVTDGDQVEMQQGEPYPIQRAFTNRSIERLFAGWSGHRQFLAKDALSEVIMTR
jgi:hypothetical protein